MTAAPPPLEPEARWRAAVSAALGGADPGTLTRHTRDGLAIRPLEPPAPSPGPGPWRAADRPVGVFARIDHPDGALAADLARADLAGGADGLALVGRGAGAAHGFGLQPGAFAAALDGVDPGVAALRLEVAPGERDAVLAAVLDAAARHGRPPGALDLDLGLDPFEAPPGTLRDRAATYRARGLAGPLLRADGRPHHAAGASEAQELAAVLSAGVAALRALEPLGLSDARDALSATLAADTDHLLTVAKFRALRRLWRNVEAGCGLPPRPLRLHGETAWRILAKRDPHTNIVRNTVAAAGAILGGADTVAVLPFTAALGLPDAAARRLARNTALVLLEEAGLGRLTDPLAGSGTLEALTTVLGERAWTLFRALEAAGGLGAALAAGTWQAEVAAMRQARRESIASGAAPLVGVTRFTEAEPGAPPPVLAPLPPEVPSDRGALHPWREAADGETPAEAT